MFMKNILDQHAKAYEGQSQYDFDNAIMLKWYPLRIIEMTQGADSLLELGVGHGYSTKIFSEHFSRHLVLDGSASVIERFKQEFPDCSAEIVKTCFEDFKSEEKFDVIVLGFVLEHVDNPFEILNIYRNFLSPSGKMYIAVPNAQALNRRLGHLAYILKDLQELSENDISLGHKRYYTVDSLLEEIRAANYELERMEGIYLKPFTTQQIISLKLDPKIINALCLMGIEYPELSCGILAELKPLA